MTKTYALAPIPFWYLPDDSGKPLGSGKMYTKSSLNLTEDKPVFQDPGGNNPWTNPINFNLNGTSGPFYWEFDDTNPEEFYFIQIYDSNDNLVYQINNFPGVSASGGGNITTNVNLKNYIVNNSFLYNDGFLGPGIPDQTIISPSAHNQIINPDMIFFNTNIGAVDTITFKQFNLGANPLTGDFIPEYYLNYTSNSFSEVKKGIQIPINPKVNILEDQQMTFSIWGESNGSGANTLDIYIVQFFGTGVGASTSNEFKAGTVTLSNSWTKNTVNFTVPDVSSFTLGSTEDDATYLEIRFPTDSNVNIDIAKPSLYAGSNVPLSDFESNQQIEALLETPRTGDIKPGSFLPSYISKGWIYLDDGTIGNSSSGATNRAHIDTWFLYNKLWLSIDDTYCPVLPGGRGVSPQADWDANKTINLPLTLNRVLSNASSSASHPLGLFTGTDTVTLTSDQLANHTHTAFGAVNFITSSGSPSANLQQNSGSLSAAAQHNTTGSVSGTFGQPHPNLQPTNYSTYMIKL